MTKKEKEILNDFKAFIDWSVKNKRSLSFTLANLNHDIVGLAKEDKWFSPRTTGYSKRKDL